VPLIRRIFAFCQGPLVLHLYSGPCTIVMYRPWFCAQNVCGLCLRSDSNLLNHCIDYLLRNSHRHSKFSHSFVLLHSRPDTSFAMYCGPIKALKHYIWKKWKWIILKLCCLLLCILLLALFIYSGPPVVTDKVLTAILGKSN
jgi:hypothetical protein